MHHFIAEKEEEGEERKSCFCEKGRVFGGCGGEEGREEEEDLSWEKSVREEENWEGRREGGHSFLPRATGQRKEKGEEEHLHTVRWLGRRKKGCGGGGRRKEEGGLFLLRSAQERGEGEKINRQASEERPRPVMDVGRGGGVCPQPQRRENVLQPTFQTGRKTRVLLYLVFPPRSLQM